MLLVLLKVVLVAGSQAESAGAGAIQSNNHNVKAEIQTSRLHSIDALSWHSIPSL